jgi:hypothetical protein
MHMEPDQKKVDNFFASNLEGLKTEPSEKAWQGIEKRYFRKGVAYWLWRVLPVLLLIGTGFTLYTIFIPTDKGAMETGQTASQDKSILPMENKLDEKIPVIPETIPEAPPEAVPETVPKAVLETVPEPPVAMGSGTPPIKVKSRNYDKITTIKPHHIAYLFPSKNKLDSIYDESRNINSPELGLVIRNDYVRQPEYWFGAQITPSVVYYPGKSNKNSWSGEFTIDYMPSRFSLQAGVGLGYYKESGEYQVSYSSYDSVGFYYDVSTFSLYPENPDSVLFELNEISIYDTVDHIVVSEIQNQYLYLRLPVKLGYNLFDTKKLSCHLHGGLVFSLLAWKDEPDVSIPAADITRIDIEETYPGRLSTSWQLTAGINFIYKINDRFGISFEPTYMQYIGKLYKPGFDYSDTRPYAIGLRTGIYVKF